MGFWPLSGYSPSNFGDQGSNPSATMHSHAENHHNCMPAANDWDFHIGYSSSRKFTRTGWRKVSFNCITMSHIRPNRIDDDSARWVHTTRAVHTVLRSAHGARLQMCSNNIT